MGLSRQKYLELVDRLQDASVSETAELAAQYGLRPPDDEPGWRLILDYPPDNGEIRAWLGEREALVWRRTIYSVVEADEPPTGEAGSVDSAQGA